MTPPEPSELIRRELETGERVLWSDQPTPHSLGRALHPSTRAGWFFVIIAAAWITFATIFMIVAHRSGWKSNGKSKPPPIAFQIGFPAFGLPFLALGVRIVRAPARAGRAAPHTAYALTDRRVIVIEGTARADDRTVISFTRDDLKHARRKEYPDGRGDLVFADVDSGANVNNRPVFVPRGVLGVPNIAEVERLIRATLRNASS